MGFTPSLQTWCAERVESLKEAMEWLLLRAASEKDTDIVVKVEHGGESIESIQNSCLEHLKDIAPLTGKKWVGVKSVSSCHYFVTNPRYIMLKSIPNPKGFIHFVEVNVQFAHFYVDFFEPCPEVWEDVQISPP